MRLPQVLSLSVSRQVIALLLVAHGGTLAAVLFGRGDIRITVIVAMAVLLSALLYRRRLQGMQRISRLTLHADGSFEIMRNSGASEMTTIHPHSTVMPLLVVLVLKTTRGLESLVVLPDALGEEDLRVLRLWLRWRAQRSLLSPMSGA